MMTGTAPGSAAKGDCHRGLVLGGGGVTGISWMMGIAIGLAERGIGLRDADHIVGTSAGAVVGALLAGSASAEDLLRRQTDPVLQVRELHPLETQLAAFASALPPLLAITDPIARGKAFGVLALSSETIDPALRRVVIASRLDGMEWPDRRLSIIAVDALTGEARMFEGRDRVSLIDAVAASCAVPGLWPAVEIGGVSYIDGGVRSYDNADMLSGCREALILSPSGSALAAAEVEQLLASTCVRAQMIFPDAISLDAIGTNPFDQSRRAVAATAGYRQGREAAAELMAVWH